MARCNRAAGETPRRLRIYDQPPAGPFYRLVGNSSAHANIPFTTSGRRRAGINARFRDAALIEQDAAKRAIRARRHAHHSTSPGLGEPVATLAQAWSPESRSANSARLTWP